MEQGRNSEVGSIGWVDLTVGNAQEVRDFYADVVGWKPEPFEMGGYSDFNMTAPGTGDSKAGICHTRGVNADLPPYWLVYFVVADLEASAARCSERGGRVLAGPRDMGPFGRYAVIQDPAGAYAALIEPPR